MAVIQDIKNDLLQKLALLADIGSNTTTNGAIIDVAHHELGLMFGVAATDYTDGSYTVQIWTSEADDMADAVQVTGLHLHGENPVITAATAEGDDVHTIGAFCVKRYVQLRVVSTGVTTGATLVGFSTQKAELMPVDQ